VPQFGAMLCTNPSRHPEHLDSLLVPHIPKKDGLIKQEYIVLYRQKKEYIVLCCSTLNSNQHAQDLKDTTIAITRIILRAGHLQQIKVPVVLIALRASYSFFVFFPKSNQGRIYRY
jgi:hypothetical protein